MRDSHKKTETASAARTVCSRLRTALLTCAGLALLAAGVYAATGYGTESDPLVTRSYLIQVVQPQLEQELKSALEQKMHSAAADGAFALAELQPGQKLTAAAGTEILLRGGDATASSGAGNAGGLLDSTLGISVAAGEKLTENHLYVIAGEGAGITAETAVRLLISGGYLID